MWLILIGGYKSIVFHAVHMEFLLFGSMLFSNVNCGKMYVSEINFFKNNISDEYGEEQ